MNLIKLLKKKIPNAYRRRISETIRRSIQQRTFALVKKFSLKTVSQSEIFANSEKYRVFPFDSEETIAIGKPCHGSDELGAIAGTIGNYNLTQPFVFETPNAELIGSIAVGFDTAGSIISDTVTGNSDCIKYIPAQTLISKHLPSWKTPQLDIACSLVNWNGGYFHWIVDCLARMQGLAHYQAQTGIKPQLIINSNPPGWQKESLRLLGYEPNDCIQWHKSRVKVKRLVVPSWRRKQNIISPQACQWLRQQMLSNLSSVGSKNLAFSPRIYISRPKTTGRHIINENEVLATLNTLGFVAYKMEDLSFSDQVKLFSQAEIVVAPHGAGLTNTIFAEKLSVIELFGSFGNPCFSALSQALGFRYGCLGLDFNPKNKNEKYNGIIVNVAKLRILVEEMLSLVSDRTLVKPNV